MELRQLRYLQAVLELGTFGGASVQAHVSQPALWQQVRALEREWGVALFERAGRRVRPTTAAVALAPRIRSILDASGQLTADVASIRAGSSIPARYAAPRYARSAAFMFEIIARYRARHPEAPLPIAVPLGTAETIEALEAGRVDLAGAVPPPGWRWRAEPLYEVWLACVGVGERDAVDVADLAAKPLAVLTPAFQSRLLLEDALRRRGLEARILVEHESPDVLLAAARAGIATAVFVSDALPLDYSGPIAEVRDRGRRMGGMLSLVWRDDASLSTAAARLKEEALAYARELRAGTDRVTSSPRVGQPAREVVPSPGQTAGRGPNRPSARPARRGA